MFQYVSFVLRYQLLNPNKKQSVLKYHQGINYKLFLMILDYS